MDDSLGTEKRSRLRNKYGVTEAEEREYTLPEEKDYEILSLVKTLENKNLSEVDRDMIELIRTQLRDDWRSPLLERLNQLLQKYS